MTTRADTDHPSQVLIFTRSHEVRFHVKLAGFIEADLPGVPVRFATFFKTAADYLRTQGREAIYLPDALREAGGLPADSGLLERLEAEALAGSGGANLQLMLQAERFLDKDPRGVEVFVRSHARLLDRLVQPRTLSLASMYDHFVYWLAGSLANARDGWHFGMVGSAVPANRTIMLRTPWETWRVETPPEACERLLDEAVRAQALPVEQRLAYMAPMPAKRGRGPRHYLRAYGDVWYDYRRGSYFAHHWLTPGKWAACKLLPRAVYSRIFEHPEPAYDWVEARQVADAGAPFVYFPLHMEPEATLLMYSPWCRDQVEAARLVSQALPIGWNLVVKENPKMRRQRPPEFYRRLRALPNAVLADPAVPSTDLSRRARATVSVAGNASLEAVLLGRSGYCLGRPPFRDLLTGADLASSLNLAGLFERLRTETGGGVRVPAAAWRRWVEGTAGVPYAYRSYGTEIGIDDADDRALPVWRYVQAAMGEAGRPQDPTKDIAIKGGL